MGKERDAHASVGDVTRYNGKQKFTPKNYLNKLNQFQMFTNGK
jgi:hypothetical protein